MSSEPPYSFCPEGRERCAASTECECERVIYEQHKQEIEQHERMGPSPTVCRVMAKFCERLGHADEAKQWADAAEIPSSAGNA